MPTFVFLAFLGLSLRVLHMHRELGRYRVIRSDAQGVMRRELVRAAEMVKPRGGDFPVPREHRVEVLRVFGCPVWREESSVGLPLSTDARLDKTSEAEFDHLFEGRFCLNAEQSNSH